MDGVKEQQEAFYDLTPVSKCKSLDELLAMIPEGEPYQAAWKCWYTIRDHEKIICSVSGGWDSDIMLDLIIRCGGKEKTTFVFNNTGLEYDATKEHIRYLEQKYGIKIKILNPEKAIPVCCKEYGVPFWSKYVSGMLSRLQKHGFKWEDEPLDVLLEKYPKCRSALRFWCNDFKTENGRTSKFNIEYVKRLKEFIIKFPPKIAFSAACCEWSKKKPAKSFLLKNGFDLNCTGVRKAEGGTRSTSYHSCYDQNFHGPDNYRPLFWWTGLDKESYTKRFNIVRSDCYEEWGIERTGCAGRPFGKDFEQELELVQQYEPKRYKAMISVFGESYEYTRKFLKFREQMNAEKSRRNETDAGQTKMEGF